MKNIFSRIKEPSTWAGLAGIFAAVAQIAPPLAAHAAAAGAIAGGVAMILREKGNDEATK